MGKTNEEDEKATQAFAALGVGFVCLIVGVPLWWKTTEVYRVQLPYSDIANLGQYRLQYTVLLDVICFDEAVSTTSLNSLTKLLHSINSKGENVDAKYHINVRRAIGDETTACKEAKSVQDLDEGMARALSDDINHIYVLLVPKSKSLELKRVFVGTHRNVIIQSSAEEKELSRLISTTVQDVVVSAKLLEKRLLSMKGLRTLKPDKESMRAAKSTPGYDITFTLVSPQPDLLDVRWDIKGGMEAYLKPFTDRIEKYAHLDINSQVLFYTGLLRQPQHHKANNCFFYTPADLPHIINPLEVKLGSHVSTNPSLEFVVYVPYRSQNPLYIYDQNGERSKTNAFLSPQWGGIHIYNVENPRPGSPLPAPVDIDMRRVMEVSLSHLRLLLGVQSQSQASGRVEIAPVGNKAIADWEVDSWLRGRCLENLATSTLTLTSLAQLLGQISNIVIRDEIGREVEISVDSIRQAQNFLSEGELEKAFFFSKQAIISSEKAFFDPSLLELLYFPEDQKFAIYIPLFLPISIPVVMSVLDALKWYRNKNKPEHPKKD